MMLEFIMMFISTLARRFLMQMLKKKRPKNRRISARDADLLNPSAFNLGCVGGVLGERRLENAQFFRLEQNFTMMSFVHLVGVAGEGHRVAKLNRHAYVGRYC